MTRLIAIAALVGVVAATRGLAADPATDDVEAALAQVDRTATAAWIDRARAAHDTPTDPMPPSTARAVAALARWSRSGAAFRLYCGGDEIHRGNVAIGVVARAALETATRADDPAVHAVLVLGRALRRADNSAYAILVGIRLAADVEAWRIRRGLPETDEMRALAPTDELPREAAAAAVRCGAEQLAYLRTTNAAGADELATAAVDLEVTRAIIALTPSDDALGRILHDRHDALLTVPPVARLVSRPGAFEDTQWALGRYRDALAGEDPDAP